MNLKRQFIAFDLSDEKKDQIADIAYDLDSLGVRGNFSPVENYHLTLAFLGDQEDVEGISRIIVKHAKGSSLFFSNHQELQFLPSRDGGTLAIKLTVEQKMIDFVNSLREDLRDHGYFSDRKSFLPHITLVRSIHKDIPQYHIKSSEYRFDSVTLFESILERGKKAKYIPLIVYPLQGGR